MVCAWWVTARSRSPRSRGILKNKVNLHSFAHSKDILDDLESWLSKQLTHISGKSPLAGAIRYALTRIPKVRPYLDHGFLELDNSEKKCKRGGRKRALGARRPMVLPGHINERWSLDFVSDAFTDGRRFRILAVIDDYS